MTLVTLGAAGLLAAILLVWPKHGLLPRLKQAKQMQTRVYREDVLKHIHKTESKGRRPTLQSIAGAVGIGLGKAAELLTGLAADGLLYDDAGTPRLTPAGHELAIHVIRAHRLWERYLSEETGFEEADWHGQAERREHDLTTADLAALAARLGNPTHDPHGDPIPTPGGELPDHGGRLLATLPVNQPAKIVHLEDEPETIYAQLAAEGLHPGQIVQLTENTPARLRFWTNGDEHILAPILAGNIYVRPIPKEDLKLPDDSRRLNELELGETARVVALTADLRGQERRRLLDLGLLPGTEVTAELRSPGGDPTAYRIRGATIALRAEQAGRVKVTATNLNGEQSNE